MHGKCMYPPLKTPLYDGLYHIWLEDNRLKLMKQYIYLTPFLFCCTGSTWLCAAGHLLVTIYNVHHSAKKWQTHSMHLSGITQIYVCSNIQHIILKLYVLTYRSSVHFNLGTFGLFYWPVLEQDEIGRVSPNRLLTIPLVQNLFNLF